MLARAHPCRLWRARPNRCKPSDDACAPVVSLPSAAALASLPAIPHHLRPPSQPREVSRRAISPVSHYSVATRVRRPRSLPEESFQGLSGRSFRHGFSQHDKGEHSSSGPSETSTRTRAFHSRPRDARDCPDHVSALGSGRRQRLVSRPPAACGNCPSDGAKRETRAVLLSDKSIGNTVDAAESLSAWHERGRWSIEALSRHNITSVANAHPPFTLLVTPALLAAAEQRSASPSPPVTAGITAERTRRDTRPTLY